MSNARIRRDLPNDEYQAAVGANNPSASNVFATIADLTSAGIPYTTASGTNVYTATIPGVVSYTDGDTYIVKFTNGNDDDSTININGIGIKTLTKQVGVQVSGGDILSGQEIVIIYDGTNFQCIGLSTNQLFAFVTNAEAVSITKGQPVYAFSGTGNRMSVKLAFNTSDATSAQTVGLVYSSSIAANQTGFIIIQGVISGVNTGAYTAGDQLYLGATAGTLTNVKPYAPNHLVYLGIVERANAGNGLVYVRTQNGYELDELHDVDLITNPPTDGQVLTYDSITSLWRNESLPSPINIYTADGTVTGDRQVDLAGNDLFFNDGLFASTFRFNSDDGSSSTLIDAGPSGISIGTSGGGTGKNINVTTTQIGLDGKFTVDNTKNTSNQNLDVVGQTKTTTFQMTTTPTAGYVLTSDASGNGTWSAAAGGLTYFTEAQSTAAPNATVPVDSLTAVSAATNADIAIVPKGTGAFTLDIADNTAAGGNKRGANAIDLSTKRTNAADVASGASSIVIGETARATNTNSFSVGLGGTGSISSGVYATAIGSWTTATGTNSFSTGSRCDATGLNSVSIGGYLYGQTTASGESSFASGGATASGDYSLAIGAGNIASGRHSVATGNNAHTFGIVGRRSHSAGVEATQGDSQASKFILRERTTGNTATTLTSDSNAGGTANQVILSNNSAYRFKGTIIGKQSGSTNVAAWDVDGIIVRGANAASTTLSLGNVTLVQNTPAWGTPTLAADTTNGGLRVQVTGAAATNIQWTAIIETTEVIYA